LKTEKNFCVAAQRPHIGLVTGRRVRYAESLIGATVEFQLPIDLGLAQLLDREIVSIPIFLSMGPCTDRREREQSMRRGAVGRK